MYLSESAFRAYAVDIHRAVFLREFGNLQVSHIPCDSFVSYFSYRSAAVAYYVMVSCGRAFQFVPDGLRGKLVAYDETGVHQQFDGVVDGGFADVEVVAFQFFVQHVHVEVSLNVADTFQNGFAFRSFPESVFSQVFDKNTVHPVCIIRICNRFFGVFLHSRQKYKAVLH
jgi:hypothetical protein